MKLYDNTFPKSTLLATSVPPVVVPTVIKYPSAPEAASQVILLAKFPQVALGVATTFVAQEGAKAGVNLISKLSTKKSISEAPSAVPSTALKAKRTSNPL